MSAASATASKPADSVGAGQPPPSSPAARSQSLRPLFDDLATAGTRLDDMLQDLDLSKEEAESLLATQQFRTHRQLRTELLSQQLQLAAQDHARFALHRLLDLSNSQHAAIARLAATQILSYAGLTPPSPDQPSLLRHLPSPSPTPPAPSPPAPPTAQPSPVPPTPPPTPPPNPLRFPLIPILLALFVLLTATALRLDRYGGTSDNYITSNVGDWQFGAIGPGTSGLATSISVGPKRPILLKGLHLNKFQATFSYGVPSGVQYSQTGLVFNAKGPEDYAYVTIPHFIYAAGLEGDEVKAGLAAVPVSATASAPPGMSDTDIIWSQVTNDGTTVTMKCIINPSGTPTDSDWSSATTYFSSTAFTGSGGQLGIWPSGVGVIKNLTIKSYNPGTSAFDITEAQDTFTADAGGYVSDTLTYDNNGNLTYDGLQSYTYDAWNRLTTTAHAYRDSGGTLHSGQVFQTISYDATGRRIIKAITGTGNLDCTYHYYLSGNSVIEERNGSDESIKDHVWGLDYIDEAIQTRINTDPTGTPAWSSYYLLQDANFNVLGIVDSSGILVERYEYTAYGQRQVFYSPGSNDPGCYAPTPISQRVITTGSITQPYGLNDFGHQGLMHDEQTGLVYNRHRILNPTLGRWNQEEPFGAEYIDSLNLYQDRRSNPIGFFDPSGNAPDPVWSDPFDMTAYTKAMALAFKLNSESHFDRIFCAKAPCADVANLLNDLQKLKREAWNRAMFHYDTANPNPNGRPFPTDGTTLVYHQQAYEYWRGMSEKIEKAQRWLLAEAVKAGCKFAMAPAPTPPPPLVPIVGGIGRRKALERYRGLKEQIEDHLRKLREDPTSQDVGHWRDEIENWIKQIEDVTGQMGDKTSQQIMEEIRQWQQQLGKVIE